MKIITKSTKTVEEIIEGIICDGNSVYTNDAGSGTGGPGIVQTEDLQAILNGYNSEEFAIVEDAELAERIIRETLEAHRVDLDDGTTWMLAASEPDQTESNPYVQYLLLWDTEA